MPLTPVAEIIGPAAAAGYAVGYFESWDIASLQGVVDAAERARAPVILGYNGEFLSRPDRLAGERLALYAAIGRAAASTAKVPCALLFNECSHEAAIDAAIDLGFNFVMPVAGDRGSSEYARWVTALTLRAHDRGIAVEAEVGQLPEGAGRHDGECTDPEYAAEFVATTEVDLLAVSVGNVHILTEGERGLDLDRLEAIRERVRVPLVLHGGTGIPRDAMAAAVARGVVKVNFGTYLKQRYLATVRDAIRHDVADPHDLLGRGGPSDVLVAARRAVRDAVLERIDWLGCRGRA
jgi:ketose-bisphosphate aldolase